LNINYENFFKDERNKIMSMDHQERMKYLFGEFKNDNDGECMSITVNCVVCGEAFNVTPSRYKEDGNCCSKKCLGENNKADNNVECYICGTRFHIKPFHLKKMKNPDRICCSKTCSSKERSERYIGIDNHQYGLKGELNSSFKSDIRISRYGYIQVRNITHPHRTSDDFVLFHRLVYEEYLKDINDFEYLEYSREINDYVLTTDVIIHHKDGNKLNNVISNLEPLCLSEHTSIHNIDKPRDRDIITQRFITSGKVVSGKLFKNHNIDAGLDVYSDEDTIISPRSSKLVSTNLKISIPDGCVGLLWSRSGLSVKNSIEVGAGCIDAGYTGEVKVHLYNHGDDIFNISKGDRIAQLLTIPININMYERVDELSDTERGTGGFGSTGL